MLRFREGEEMKKTVVICAGIGLVVWLLVRDQSAGFLPLSCSTRLRLSGALDQLKGSGEQTIGKLTEDPLLRTKGVADDALGSAKSGIGRSADALRDLIAE